MEMVCSGNLNSYNLKTIEISKKFSAGEYPVSKNKVLPFTYQTVSYTHLTLPTIA